MSDNKKKCYNLCVKIPKELLKEFNTEIVYKHGRIYGNVPKSVRKAIKLWANTQKLEREKLEHNL